MSEQSVQYIKLGEGNRIAKSCIQQGILALGFWTSKDDMFEACCRRDWDTANELLLKYRSEQNGKKPRSVADDLRQVRRFFESDGTTTWVTFDDRKMYWGNAEAHNFERCEIDGHTWVVRAMESSWNCFDKAGNELRVDDLAGHLTMVSQYRGTICNVNDPAYVLRRISGHASEVYCMAQRARVEIVDAIGAMIGALNPDDFELLVETIFVNTGWKRIGRSGGTEELIDLLLSRPSLVSDKDEIVAVQMKSDTNQRELDSYARSLSATYANAFYAYHTGVLKQPENHAIKLLDRAHVAPLVLKAGLLDWLMERVK